MSVHHSYFVNKESGTYADTLAVYGFAAVLDEVLKRVRDRLRDHGVTLHDRGPYYEITHEGAPLADAEIEQCDFFVAPGATGFFITDRKRREAPPDAPVRDMDVEWEQVRQYAARRKELWDEEVRGTDLGNQLQDMAPLPDWSVVTWLGDTRMQAQGIYNGLIAQWCATREHFTANLKALFALAATPEPDVKVIAAAWSQAMGQTRRAARTVTSSQLFNPHQGKGLNQPKANALKMDNVKDNFWLVEYLKAVGIWLATAPRTTPDRERKTYVLAPLHLPLREHRTVFHAFAGRLWNQPQRDTTSLKLDITSLLLYLRTLLDYSEAAQRRGEDHDFEAVFGEPLRPERTVAGMHVVQFKLLSQQAYTMTHMGFLGLPRWTAAARDWDEVFALQAVIEEHLRVVSGIDETHSDGYDLLRRYRDFAAGGRWAAFFDFAVGYSGYVMRAFHAGRSPWLFSTQSLRRLLMNATRPDQPYSTIVQNEGFQNIAYAIRHSTIVPQGQMARHKRGKGEKPLYEVRYGLGQALKQKANNAKEFLAALGDFVSTYSAETYQTFENTGSRRRRDLQVSDLAEVTRLVDDFGPEVVCNLLVAFGYASDFPKEDTANTGNDAGTQ